MIRIFFLDYQYLTELIVDNTKKHKLSLEVMPNYTYHFYIILTIFNTMLNQFQVTNNSTDGSKVPSSGTFYFVELAGCEHIRTVTTSSQQLRESHQNIKYVRTYARFCKLKAFFHFFVLSFYAVVC